MAYNRKQCPSRGEQLAHAAYSRHIHDHTGSMCPGWTLQVTMSPQRQSTPDSSDEEGSDFEENYSMTYEDASFDFGSATDEEDQVIFGSSYSLDMGKLSDVNQESSIRSLSSTDSQDTESAEGIWESSDDDHDSDDCYACENQIANNIQFGVSFFLNFFQLTYRVSERAMTTLLTFLRTLIMYLATVSQGNSVLKVLAQAISKSLYSVRKIVARNQDGVTEYVVCPM